MNRAMQQDTKLRALIRLQRALARSSDPFRRLVGPLIIGGLLDEHLSALTDRELAQFISDNLGNDVGMLMPEMVLWQQIVRRLFRSTAREFAAEDAEKQRGRRLCPKCGRQMCMHFGIGQAFLKCDSVKCGYEQPLNLKATHACRRSPDQTRDGRRFHRLTSLITDRARTKRESIAAVVGCGRFPSLSRPL